MSLLPPQELINKAKIYKDGLPKGRNGTAWTMDTFSVYVSMLYPHVTVVPGQIWTGSHTKYKFHCDKHGMYEANATHVLKLTGTSAAGSQCPGCSNDATKARNDAITAAFVGQTSPDGHLILEHIGYHQAPSCKKLGRIGKAIFRYQCAACGSTEGKARGNDLKKPGNTTHCGCLSKRDSRLKFTRSKKRASAPCHIYLFSTIGDTAMKIGIAKDVSKRASVSYEEELFVSAGLTRAQAWSVEQVMLHRFRKIGLTYDLTNVPAWQSGDESGGTEVFAYIDFMTVISQIRSLMFELLTLSWEQLLDKYIPLEEMTHHQLYRWDGKHQHQTDGAGYTGQPYTSVFEL